MNAPVHNPLAISGYRKLSDEEIALMNDIKALEAHCGLLCQNLRRYQPARPGETVPGTVDQRWVSIGITHLQEGFMALVRSVAQPKDVFSAA